MDDLLYMVAFLLLLAACREGISIKDEERFDCFPEASATPTDCGKRGCIWVNVTGSGANPVSCHVLTLLLPTNGARYQWTDGIFISL